MNTFDASVDSADQFVTMVGALNEVVLHIEMRSPTRPERGDQIKALNGEMFRFIEVREFKSRKTRTGGGGAISNLYTAFIARVNQ